MPTVTGIKKPGIIVQCAVRQIDGVILNQMRNVDEARVYVMCAMRGFFISVLSCVAARFLRH